MKLANTTSYFINRPVFQKKNIKLLIIQMTVLALFLLTPCLLWAEAPSYLVDTPRAKEIWDNVPKTPEELLQIIKELKDNPDMNGFEFGERVMGVARENWGMSGGTFSRGYNKTETGYIPFVIGPRDRGPTGTIVDPPTPYNFNWGEINLDQDDHLLSISLRSFDKGFCVTPPLVRQMLGEADRVVRRRNSLTLMYAKQYWIKIIFYIKDHYKALPDHSWERLFDAKGIEDEFNILKDVCSREITLSRH